MQIHIYPIYSAHSVIKFVSVDRHIYIVQPHIYVYIYPYLYALIYLHTHLQIYIYPIHLLGEYKPNMHIHIYILTNQIYVNMYAFIL